MNDVCKWLADDTCANVDSAYCGYFCPSTENPRCCVHYEEKEKTTSNDRE